MTIRTILWHSVWQS